MFKGKTGPTVERVHEALT